jgi:hypothetical protein
MNRRERRKQRITRQRAASVLKSVAPDNACTDHRGQAPAQAGSIPISHNASAGGADSQSAASRLVGTHGSGVACDDSDLKHAQTSPVSEQANASTGPRTEEGKAISSRNAVKHNLCSTRLTGTDLEELNAIRAKLEHEWEPGTETEGMLLDQMALSQWRMERALSLELAAFDDSHIDQALLSLAIRYRTSAERNFYKALTELQRLRTAIREDARRQEQEAEAAAHREMERLCFAPIAGAPQFVSQKPSTPPAEPDLDAAKAPIDAKIRHFAMPLERQ